MVAVIASPELHAAVLIGCAALLIVWQSQEISRTRIVTACVLVALVIGCQVLFADQVVLNPCDVYEKYSWEWWFFGCWGLPG